MESFEQFNLNRSLLKGIHAIGFESPTPVQTAAFPVVMSGKDVVGIAQTGTGKTLAYLMPILNQLKFSKEPHPRVLIMVPTRELVVQIVKNIEELSKFQNVKVYGIYGGVNIKTQKIELQEGFDILVATPGRFFDLAVSYAFSLKMIKKLVIDEVDVMLDLGFRTQLKNIFDLLPESRQNIMFSATMTDEVSELIEDFFIAPHRVNIAVSGTPLENITQLCYPVKNFNTKVNLLTDLLVDTETYKKVIVFISGKKLAGQLEEALAEQFGNDVSVIHSDKSQNNRIATIEKFDSGELRVLIATDVISRGIDLDNVSHVVNFDIPLFPENYMHRIGRSGRAKAKGNAISFYTEKEKPLKEAIENLMNMKIPELPFPEHVEENNQLIPEEVERVSQTQSRNRERENSNPAFHEKSEKNSKVNLGGSYHRKLAEKYKKPLKRGDKILNMNKKKRK